MMGKGACWSDDEVKALLSVWREASIQKELDGAVRNKAVFSKIAKRLQDAGFEKDWVQCRVKVKNLKTLYKKVKDNNARSGRARIVCPHFELLDSILGARPATEPPEVIEAMSDDPGNHSDASDTLNDGAQDKGARGSEEEQNEGEQNESEQGDRAGERNEVEPGRDDEEQARGDKQPPAKKQKTKGKKTTAEKITESMMKGFMEFQERSEERFMKFEELRAKEDRAHEERLLRLLVASQQPSHVPQYPSMYYTGQHNNFDNESFSSDY